MARPHAIDHEPEEAYRAMAGDELRESAAEEWSEATIGDVADSSR